MTALDPKHAFKMSHMNGRKRPESGRRRYEQDAPTAVVPADASGRPI